MGTAAGSFLFARIRRDGRDERFDHSRPDPLRFLHDLDAAGFVGLAHLGVRTGDHHGHRAADRLGVRLVGIVVWFSGFAIEVVADHQKSVPAAQTTRVASSIWPVGVVPSSELLRRDHALDGGSADGLTRAVRWQLVTLVSPMFVYLLLTRISGIPMLEARAEKRWGDDEEFLAYTRRTPVLVPRPPRG